MRHIHDHIAKYLEGQLDAAARSRFEGHISSCSECRAEFAASREVWLEMSDAGRLLRRAPVNVGRQWNLVRRRLHLPAQRPSHEAPRRLSWKMSLSVAAAVMAAVSSMSLNPARADGPAIPSIQTPGGAAASVAELPTQASTLVVVEQTPTLTLTPVK